MGYVLNNQTALARLLFRDHSPLHPLSFNPHSNYVDADTETHIFARQCFNASNARFTSFGNTDSRPEQEIVKK